LGAGILLAVFLWTWWLYSTKEVQLEPTAERPGGRVKARSWLAQVMHRGYGSPVPISGTLTRTRFGTVELRPGGREIGGTWSEADWRRLADHAGELGVAVSDEKQNAALLERTWGRHHPGLRYLRSLLLLVALAVVVAAGASWILWGTTAQTLVAVAFAYALVFLNGLIYRRTSLPADERA
jgi:hypothetical protein